jgi:hypothetical protein
VTVSDVTNSCGPTPGTRYVPKEEPQPQEPAVNDCGAFKWGALALSIIFGLGAIIGTVILGVTTIVCPLLPLFVLGCTALSGGGLGLFQVLRNKEGAE